MCHPSPPRPSDAPPSRLLGGASKGWLLRGGALLCAAALHLGTCTPNLAAAPRHRGSEGAFETADTSWEGTSEFVQLAIERLGRDRVRLSATLDYAELSESDGLLVLHPEVELSFEEVSRFLRGGGRLSLADDFGRGDALLGRFGIRRIAAPARPLHALRNNPALAIARPTSEMVAGVERGRHPIATHVEEVITNHPTGLSHPELTPVLEIPAADGAPVPLAVTGIIAGRGRMLAIGDPSIFINLMIRYPGNRAFAEGVIDYLVADDEEGRGSGRLFIVAGAFRQTGHFGGGTRWSDALFDNLRDLRTEVGQWREAGLPDPAAWALAWLAALAAGGWLLAHAVRRHRPTVPRFVRPVPEIALGGLAGRASVLAAPTTSAVLPLLELKTALQEVLGQRLHAPAPIPLEHLSRRCRDAGLLTPSDCDLLQGVAARLRQVEQSLVQRAPLKIRESELRELHGEILGLVERVRATAASSSRPSGPPPPSPHLSSEQADPKQQV